MSQVRPYTRHQLQRFVNSAAYLGARGAGAAPMARAFLAASSQYLSQAAPLVTYPFSVAAWFYDTGAGGILWSSCNAASDTDYWYIGVSASAATAVARQSTNDPIASTTTYAANTWNLCTGVFNSATDRRVFLNGGGKATGTTNLTPTPSRSAVGCLYRLTIGSYWAGSIGPVTIWNVALSDADAAALFTPCILNGAIGYPAPWLVRPDGLLHAWPLFGNGSPELDQGGLAKNLTLVNTPTKSTTRPPIVYPPGMAWVTGS